MNVPKTFVEPLAGYFVDVWSKLRHVPFNPHSLMKLQTLKYCRDRSGATTAVEIGTYKGIMARRLSHLFPKVVSVEIVPDLHHQARRNCAARKNIELLLGDGQELLPKIVADNRNVLLFLDGHFSGGDTGQGDEPEPVLHELDLIVPHIENIAAVVVDDFRLFGVDKGWPPKSEVLAKVEKTLPSRGWTHHIFYDQVIAIRKAAIA